MAAAHSRLGRTLVDGRRWAHLNWFAENCRTLVTQWRALSAETAAEEPHTAETLTECADALQCLLSHLEDMPHRERVVTHG